MSSLSCFPEYILIKLSTYQGTIDTEDEPISSKIPQYHANNSTHKLGRILSRSRSDAIKGTNTKSRISRHQVLKRQRLTSPDSGDARYLGTAADPEERDAKKRRKIESGEVSRNTVVPRACHYGLAMLTPKVDEQRGRCGFIRRQANWFLCHINAQPKTIPSRSAC